MTTWRPKLSEQDVSPGRDLLNSVFGNNDNAVQRIDTGFEADVLEKFLRAAPDASQNLNDVLKISPRTLTRRRSEGRFSSAESDRFYRLVNLYAQAADVLGSVEAADEWMTSPALALEDASPLAYSRNAAGAKRVERLLLRLEHGVYS